MNSERRSGRAAFGAERADARVVAELHTFYQLPAGSIDVWIAARALRVYVVDVAMRERCATAVQQALGKWYRGSRAAVQVTFTEDGELQATVRVRWATPSLMRPAPWLSYRIDRVETCGTVVDTANVTGGPMGEPS